MDVAALLLTGGTSRRMGRDKAALGADPPAPFPTTWATRTAMLLRAVAAPVIELGPGHTGGEHLPDPVAGAGPLVALAGGARALAARGWHGPVLVVATDLPRLTPGFLAWLAGHPSDRSVLPTSGGRDQPLCARYRAEDLARAAALVASGRRSLRALIAVVGPYRAGPDEWGAPAGDLLALDDVDTPVDLERLVP
jgi:molybdopterin-guanine dinucleotide biosynthesis protein A